jgi:hypothetical protein
VSLTYENSVVTEKVHFFVALSNDVDVLYLFVRQLLWYFFTNHTTHGRGSSMK